MAKALVVSELADDAPPFEAERGFAAAWLENIPQQIDFYLSCAEGRHQAQTIADCGYRTLTQKCRLGRSPSQGVGKGSDGQLCEVVC
jgi:hypothetical protein